MERGVVGYVMTQYMSLPLRDEYAMVRAEGFGLSSVEPRLVCAMEGGPLDLGVLETTRYVVELSEHVRLNRDRARELGQRLRDAVLAVPKWNTHYHLCDGTERTASYVLVLDALNFCFWGEPAWETSYQGEQLQGYWALAASLKRAVEQGLPLLEGAFLADITAEQLAEVFRGQGQIPLFQERLAILHEVGQVLQEKYGGRFAPMVEAAGRSARRLVGTLAADFPSFRDVARYKGREVRFYKRAQICVADLYGSFGGQRWGEFEDMESLTAFADYKLPQILRHLGMLEYAPELAEKVDSLRPLEPGSPEEVEIRANTLWAVELVRQSLAQGGCEMRSFEVDWVLWNLAQDERGMLPHHRTRTIWY